ncbi:MAG: elongation factor EF-2 [Thermoplasmata archaeon]|nr:elongation factor EF-2 [Thermoplasmata archaeon]
MGRKEDNIMKATAIMDKLSHIRNIDIAAHIDHGKTTLSDNLIAGAGMMSEDLAGKQLLLDFHEDEQQRGITIDSANVSMVHVYKGEEYLINLIDTPGHVDFGGDVTRAMRAVDGCIIVVCAVEGVMPQTETVVRQALREKVKPTLFINKVDRLINELRVTPEQMQERFIAIIKEVNQLIRKMVPAEFKNEWGINVEDGSVSFGSAYYNWAISVPYMKATGLTFKDIYDHLANEDQKALAKKAPVHQILLDMVITHLPDPLVAQKYRIPHIWHGDIESKEGRSMITVDKNGPTVFMVTKIFLDPHAGEIAAGRLYSGTIEKGQELHIIGMPKPNRVQQVSLFVGPDRINVERIIAGNIVASVGLKDAIAGSTVTSDPELEAFERIVHISEPVVTVAIEAKHVKDLPKLIEVLRKVGKADPSIQIEINPETGESLISGMGELHLEIVQNRIITEHGVDVVSSQPIVVYRETVHKKAGPFEGKSPNKHNRFYIEVEPLPLAAAEAIREGKVHMGKVRKKDQKEIIDTFVQCGLEKEEARKIVSIHGQNLLIDATKGIQYLYETMELIEEGFETAMKTGPLANEPVNRVKVKLVDAKLHEDSIHRGPGQVLPAVKAAIYGALLQADDVLLEPMQRVFITIPQDLMGAATRQLQSRRSVIETMDADQGDMAQIVSKSPVAEMFGFAGAIRSATQGRALWTTEHSGFDIVPREIQEKVVRQIRERKGLKPDPPTWHNYVY